MNLEAIPFFEWTNKYENHDLHLDDERVVGHAQHALLVADVLDLFETDDVGDGQDFEGVVLLCCLFPAQIHPAESSSAWNK